MKLKYTLVLGGLLGVFPLFAQMGGKYVFGFLNLPTGARSAALGGYSIPVQDATVDFALHNPALANEKMLGNYSIQQSLMPSGINFGSFATAFTLLKGNIVPYIRYVSFGTIQGYDPIGNPTNTFTAFDYQAGASYGFSLNPIFSLGVNAGIIGSHLETYSSYGMSGSFSILAAHPNELVSGTLMVKNIGIQLKGYTQGNAFKPLPLEVLGSVSVKLKHAPLRFTFTGHHLNQWKIAYFDPSILPSIDGLTGDTIQPPKISFVEQLGRHLSLHAELISKGILQIRFGFDYHRRQELKLEQLPGLAGLSMGLGLNFRKFTLDYGFMIMSRAGITNHLGINFTLNKPKKSTR